MQETFEFMMARIGNADRWVPACGGNETPTITRSGRKILYCWNPYTGKHAYIDCATDMLLTNEEAFALLA